MSETVSPRKGVFLFSEVPVGGGLAKWSKITFYCAFCKSAVAPSKEVVILDAVLRSDA